MALRERRFRTSFQSARGVALAACWAVAAAGRAGAQAPLRCDLQLNTTPGAGAEGACLDLVALQAGGAPIVTAGNATRVSVDGFKICKSAFTVTHPAGADIVFIYDNSGSMVPGFARINAATGDTTFYHISGCSRAAGTPMTYTTLLGPRTIQQVDETANCQNNSLAGDPYFARSKAIEKAVDYLVTASPNSTVGAMSFARDVGNQQAPLQLSGPGNADLVKASLALDSITATNYVPALTQAHDWLEDTAYTRNARQAIVFISDGEPSDGNALNTWIRDTGNTGIPIYTIALGDSTATFDRMKEISTATQGAFYLVNPKNIAQMNEVMQNIIKAITSVVAPTAIEVANNSFAPPMVSKSVGIKSNADSSFSLVMDSIVALKQGPNALGVKITMSNGEVRNFTLGIQADGPAATSTGQNLTCYAMPTLSLLNQAGTVDSAYPSGPVKYDVRLTRATSDLQQVIVKATSADSAKSGWGDAESIVLTQASATGGTTVNVKDDYPFNGTAGIKAIKGDNTLQAAPAGEVVLTWTHPRDARETATFRLPGKSVPTAEGFGQIVRATDAPHGVPIPVPVSDPVVIRGGATLVTDGVHAVLTDKGDLNNPHNLDDAVLDPNHTPTFVVTTASSFSYEFSIFDHLGLFLNSASGMVDSARWEQMRGNADSLACAITILPVARNGQRFGTGAYILRGTLTTRQTNRPDPGKPKFVKSTVIPILNRFGYIR